jgi:glycosyltransferase involved in cell wall biosynthesis
MNWAARSAFSGLCGRNEREPPASSGICPMLLNAVMCVWNEEDIIASTVQHAFAQGCSNVFIVDNASTDRTVELAVNAGARLAAVFETKDFDEDQKVVHLNATVKYINDTTPDEQIWWLYIDADEFPNFDNKFTIIDALKQLDSSIRAVHGHLFDHLPTHQPYHVQGFHPADFQPLCAKTSGNKVPLLRYDKGHPHLWSIGGAHDFVTHREIVPTIKDILHIHHFPHRHPEFTFPRLKKLAKTRNNWYKSFLSKVHTSNASAYEARYNQLRTIYAKNTHLGLKTTTLPYDYKSIVRWYAIHQEKQFSSSKYEQSLCAAIYYFFLEEYDIALCRFNDAFNVCDDNYIKLWLMMKTAECLAHTDIDDAHSIISIIHESNNSELNAYIDKCFDYHANMQYKKDNVVKDMIGKVALYQSVFPDGIEESYRKLTAKIAGNLFKE